MEDAMTGGGKTGIEIQVGLSPGQRTVGKILTALHLQALGAAVAKMVKAQIVVDGVERTEPLYEAHFVEAAPGMHHVEMAMLGRGPGPVELQKLMVGKAMDVTVEPGRVTVLRYTPRDGIGATLELLETRSA